MGDATRWRAVSMRRLHLFEIEDQPWCPGILRDGGTAYITRFCELTGLLRGLEPQLRALVAACPGQPVVDLCSGAGGPARLMAELLHDTGVEVQCTDLFPNVAALDHAAAQSERVSRHPTPVDAMHVPDTLTGPRTLFNGFHHFRPPQARQILEDAVDKRVPIGVFEFVGRQWHAIPGMLGVPLAVAALVPTLRPFRWGWVPLTYVLPLLPLLVAWDGLVSCLRVYDPRELRELVQGLDSYDWDIGTFPLPFPGRGTYLVGTPRG